MGFFLKYRFMRERFIDDVKIFVKGGDGGNGCTSTRREKGVPYGGPDGGNGGRGGSVILKVSPHENDLTDFKFKAHFKAERGDHGQGSNKEGKNGADLTIPVPAGTIVYDVESGRPIADLTEYDSTFVVATGGRGGRGNAAFATPRHRVPTFCEKGSKGEERWVRLVLKVLADVGIIGYPNAGKSSFLSKVTAAAPKIASYPFTTIHPNLGVVAKESNIMVLADLPGLIDGAHEGAGLGLQFLKHIERTRVLLHMIDLSSPEFQAAPFEYYSSIRNELALYDENLIERPELTVLNKSDLLQPDEIEKYQKQLSEHGVNSIVISCEAESGIEQVVDGLFQLLETAPIPEEQIEIYEIPKPVGVKFEVKSVSDYFVVESPALEKFIAKLDLDNYDAVSYLQHRLKRLGVEDALIEAGACEGNIVVIGENEFDFSPGI